MVKQSWPVPRQFERRALEARLHVTAINGSQFRGWCNDVGEGGLGATVAAPLTLGDEVELEFQLPKHARPLRVPARVRYSSGFRFGFEFLSLSPEQRRVILDYQRSADPAHRFLMT